MIDNLNQSIAYICPDCSAISEQRLNIFDFSGGSFTIKCTDKKCRKDIGSISCYHDKYRISMSCAFCDEDHEFIISKSSFWSRDFFAFKCPNTNFDLFFLGDSDKIQKAIKKQEEDFAEMEEDFPEDISLIYDILLRLQQLSDSGSIICSCGNKDILPLPCENGMMLVCNKCGAKKIIPATEDELDVLMDTEFIELKK